VLERASHDINHQLRSFLREHRLRSERRRRVHHIDHLLEQLEALNMQEEALIPDDLSDELAYVFASYAKDAEHAGQVSPLVQETMERLYDLQNELLIEGRAGFVEAEEFLVDPAVRRPGRRPRWT
jgi:Uri superfamily endonuclease